MVDDGERNRRKTALITGASRGLGRALARALAREGWRPILNARGRAELDALARELAGDPGVVVLAGDVADPWARAALTGAAEEAGGLDLLINNASVLGTTPLPRLADQPVEDLRRAFEVNTLAPLALAQALLPLLRTRGGAILNITSDAAVEAYETWGGYGATKAALEQISHVLAAEEPGVRVWWVDPGEMRTGMLQEAMPGEDLSGTPAPEERAAPAIMRLIARRAASGRHTIADLLAETVSRG